MPIEIPQIDDRRYADLLQEALGRIPVHNPEWTNFNHSDPGVTLVEVFAFMMESVLFRANLIPTRNRLKFLSLLQIPMDPGNPAQGLITVANVRGPDRPITLEQGLDVRAGQVPFVTRRTLDVMPLEARAYYKRSIEPEARIRDYYTQLYYSYFDEPTDPSPDPDVPIRLYESLPLPSSGSAIDLGTHAFDNSIWLALLARPVDKPFDATTRERIRQRIAGKTVSIGIVPGRRAEERVLPAGRPASADGVAVTVQLPKVGTGEVDPRRVEYIPARLVQAPTELFLDSAVLAVTLPDDPAAISTWEDLDTQTAGVGNLPPDLSETGLADRVITWLRISWPASTKVFVEWIGINAVPIDQRVVVHGERLGTGTSEPGQTVTLANRPVVPGSVQLETISGGDVQRWREVDNLDAQPGEERGDASRVFSVDAESGVVRFGDGVRGARPPLEVPIRATYAYSMGARGNVPAGAITSSPTLPSGLSVRNPVPTRGGTDPSDAATGEKLIGQYLRHRDRLVTFEDFAHIAFRTPAARINRVEVIGAWSPELTELSPGSAPGVVTVLAIPEDDPDHPDAPRANHSFLKAIGDYLEPRRLVTTEVRVVGPRYKRLALSVGVRMVPSAPGEDRPVAWEDVRERIHVALKQFLSPRRTGEDAPGWPLGKTVYAKEIEAAVSRVRGVQFVNGVSMQAIGEGEVPRDTVPMIGIELPELGVFSASPGDPVPLRDLLERAPPPVLDEDGPPRLPVPFVPDECT